ncbi:MAG: hypothetical protein NTW68_05305 [candidate division NC10 bacterium]|nr:hypothetical protein [candidate division NC10 bacterium]
MAFERIRRLPPIFWPTVFLILSIVGIYGGMELYSNWTKTKAREESRILSERHEAALNRIASRHGADRVHVAMDDQYSVQAQRRITAQAGQRVLVESKIDDVLDAGPNLVTVLGEIAGSDYPFWRFQATCSDEVVRTVLSRDRSEGIWAAIIEQESLLVRKRKSDPDEVEDRVLVGRCVAFEQISEN